MNRMEKFCVCPATANSGAEAPFACGAAAKSSAGTTAELSGTNLDEHAQKSSVRSARRV